MRLNGRLKSMIAAATVVLAFGIGGANAQQVEKKDLKLAVGGKPLLYYLPLTIAERLGYFKEAGLNVEISDFGGGAKSLQALVGGSADIVTGAFDHTVQMQAKGQPITAVTLLGRYPGIVLAAVNKAGAIKSVKELKGKKIGVTAPGSSTNFMVNYLLTQNGMKPEDVSFIGVGGGPSAVAAVKRGEIDAIANLDPVISQLQADGDITIIDDTRTEKGTLDTYGGPYPAAVLYTTPAFIKENPKTTQALVDVFVKTMKWIDQAKTEDVLKVLPEEYFLGNKTLYAQAYEHSKPTYSPDGRFTREGAEAAYKVLKAFDPAVASASIDLDKTYTNAYVEDALKRLK
ncbi:ABC transporter substrate-binding protein [Azospirillum rugosum]|uniref:NitT/TauT family transport system substrate-binding protein n=1 Tax=Azospirillum rugosum TaxID=416170 RepID=A0ABS4SG30_9PROT|nr:ABC transporter substrate-binding protein [Azospirillum rugosum]MBP2291169.1 NitT/TauT family transport system substrate-binding protein [Azospirillum rugosum]MDQ0524767.1 NitT/TauT family transport system substrate-binding protein [Azospirillum rugosum]